MYPNHAARHGPLFHNGIWVISHQLQSKHMVHTHETPPLQGLGQVNVAAPEIWSIVSTPLLNSLKETGFVEAFKLSISKESFSIVGC